MFSKKLSAFLLLLIVFLSYTYARDSIKTSGKPLNPKAGREIILKEIMRIEDAGEDYFFKYIDDVRIAPDGTIIIKGWQQLYQFSTDGKYLRDYYKKGQGPGECVYMGNFIFDEANHLIIHGSNPPKILFYDLAGRYKKESRIIKHKGFLHFIHHYNN